MKTRNRETPKSIESRKILLNLRLQAKANCFWGASIYSSRQQFNKNCGKLWTKSFKLSHFESLSFKLNGQSEIAHKICQSKMTFFVIRFPKPVIIQSIWNLWSKTKQKGLTKLNKRSVFTEHSINKGFKSRRAWSFLTRLTIGRTTEGTLGRWSSTVANRARRSVGGGSR